MYAYRTPGVYFEWQDMSPVQVPALRTDITGLVGIAARGPLHKAIRIESWTQYISLFGGHIAQGYLAYAVEGFFANGGRTCWVVRVANPEAAKSATLTLTDDLDRPSLKLRATSPGTWAHRLIVTLLRTGMERFSLILRHLEGEQEVWANLSMSPEDPRYVLELLNNKASGSALVSAEDMGSHNTPGALLADIALSDDMGRHSLRLTANASGVLTVTVRRSEEGRFTLLLKHENGEHESWADLSMQHNDPRFVIDILENEISGSGLVQAEDLESQTPAPLNTPAVGTYSSNWLSGGTDGLVTLQPAHLSGEGSPTGTCWGLGCLESVDELSILAMPDIMPKPAYARTFKPAQPDCSRLETRQEQTEPLPEAKPEQPPRFANVVVSELQQALVRQCEKLKDRVAILDPLPEHRSRKSVMDWRRNFDTSYAAFYFPWLRMPDVLQLEGLLRPIPPSGHIAGIYARGDLQVGVHKPPANQVIESAKALEVAIDDSLHGELNDRQINALRIYSGRGLRVSGARTLSSDINLRYINVRRLLTMIKEAIEEGTQDLVFEPHNQDLWRKIERRVRAFLDRLWRSGSLDGATAEAAYSVRCDKETNPPSVQDTGRVICEIGVLPPWPAEFVIVRIGFTQSGAEIIEEGG